MTELLLDKRMLLPIQVSLKLAIRALLRGGRNLRQGQEQNLGFQTLSVLTPFKYRKGELGLVRDSMVEYVFMYGTETQLMGYISVPYLLDFFRCLECPRASFTGCLSSTLSQSGYSPASRHTVSNVLAREQLDGKPSSNFPWPLTTPQSQPRCTLAGGEALQ